jgi:hydroxyacylglutathione hydrolase
MEAPVIFTFNPFQENTFLIASGGECVIIDPGCFDRREKQELEDFVLENSLKPVRLLNTHCHIDHVLGNAFVSEKWNLKPEIHQDDLSILQAMPNYGHMFGVGGIEESPMPEKFLNEGDVIEFGNCKLDILFVPGHAPGHIVFINHKEKYIIGGDCLFNGSIGRTDLPGGNHETLLKSISEKLYSLPDDYTVFPGHGPETTIGHEKKFNPFVRGK